jgi:hypothetical protein
MVQAESDKRIANQPVAFNRVMAGFTNAVAAVVNSRQRAIHFGEERLKAVRTIMVQNRMLQFVAPVQQLLAYESVNICRHSDLLL